MKNYLVRRNKKWIKLFVTLFFIVLPILSNSQQKHTALTSENPSTHGMLIFGKGKIYAYHLPMFHTPHDYQIILELELEGTSKDLFVKDQRDHMDYGTYTIEPETFVLPQMIAKGNSFMADLYRGHFERGGELLISKVKVVIKEVLFYDKFNSTQEKSASSNFILFGNEKEQFMAHLLTSKPDFDQLIEIKAPFIFLQKGRASVRAIADSSENIPIGVSSNEIQITIDSFKEPIILLRQLYLEFGDLK